VSAVLRTAPIFQSARNVADPTSRKLDEFESYPTGWAYGQGLSFEASVMNAARTLLIAGQSIGLFSADVFPGLEGEIRVTFYAERDYWEFTVLASGEIEYLHEQDNEPVDERPALSLEHALEEIETQGHRKWNVFASSHPNISMAGSGDSRILVSSLQAQMAQSQSSMRTAPRQTPGLFAFTSGRITGT
jgi:hypothetical protein